MVMENVLIEGFANVTKAIPVLHVLPMTAFTMSILPRRKRHLRVSMDYHTCNGDTLCRYVILLTHFIFLFSIVVSRMMFPTSLLVLFCILAVGFVASLVFIRYSQRNSQAKYKSLGTFDSPTAKSHASGGGVTGGSGTAVYQNSARADYAIPQSQNVVTYCVIDDRLVDQ